MMSGVIFTVPDRCKRCYSCIRECPAKAIRVVNGQALIIQDRCISCGNCLVVCSQHAKCIVSNIEYTRSEILSDIECERIAMVAPSFAASFPDSYDKVPAALKRLGFDTVVETAFGADLISGEYVDAVMNADVRPVISTACPAVFNYIQKYYNHLVPNLAKIVSPMIALGRYLKKENGEKTKIVFVGPCVAKKDEFTDEPVEGIIDSVITFSELKEMFFEDNIVLSELETVPFDPPRASLGKAFPLAGGLLKSTDLPGDVLDDEIVVVEGREKVLEIIGEISNKNINARFVDILFCEGCISGPVVDSELNFYSKREKVIEFIKKDLKQVDKKVWKSNIFNSRDMDFSRTFIKTSQKKPTPEEAVITEILGTFGIHNKNDELNCGACGYSTCREFAIAIAKGLSEKEMCLPHLLDEIREAYDNLHETEAALHSAEKLASIGQLAAGVAHEINNPLGTIMVYAGLLKKLCDKHKIEADIGGDLEMIMGEANRCKNIVANLLNFARQGKLNVSTFDIIAEVKAIMKKLSVTGKLDGISVEIDLPETAVVIQGDRDQIEQVIANLVLNAVDAMADKQTRKIRIRHEDLGENLKIYFADSGGGIKKEHFSKLFTPFFTTKEAGKGTGLGLAIAYGIMKMHKGDINFKSEEGKGTEFFINLPKKQFLNI
ncbi:MAG: histidine kinase [Ignavibacteriales bacterium]|nr:histidine kinase [Ignavibacteriales bacterium]MBK8664113.1 histidine kinase [Ignavibacteriales bacterium]MBP7543659.1 histidine kinase [Ignavibacteriaceae bacterium]MBP9122516.1 histidine kinase [Ignavibacteriaceae bacterium]